MYVSVDYLQRKQTLLLKTKVYILRNRIEKRVRLTTYLYCVHHVLSDNVIRLSVLDGYAVYL